MSSCNHSLTVNTILKH